MEGPLLLAKGPRDSVCSAQGEVLFSRSAGSPRRCGGQGDILSGTVAATISWAVAHAQSQVCSFIRCLADTRSVLPRSLAYCSIGAPPLMAQVSGALPDCLQASKCCLQVSWVSTCHTSTLHTYHHTHGLPCIPHLPSMLVHA